MQCNRAQSGAGQRSEKRHDVTAMCRRSEGSSDEHTLHDLMIKPTSGYHRAWRSVFQVSCDDKALHFTSVETPLASNCLLLLLLLQQVSCTSATTSNREEGVYILSHIQAERPTGMETASQHSQKLLLLVEMTGDRKTGLSLFRYRLVDNNKERYWELLVRNLFENCISVGSISHDVLVKSIFSTLQHRNEIIFWVLCAVSPHASQRLDGCMQCTVPLRIQRPLLPSGVMAPPLFSLLWESERLSLLSSEPSSDSSFATSEMSFYVNETVWRICCLYARDTETEEASAAWTKWKQHSYFLALAKLQSPKYVRVHDVPPNWF